MYRSKFLNPFWKVMQDVVCNNLQKIQKHSNNLNGHCSITLKRYNLPLHDDR